MCFFHSTFDPRVRDALAVYTDDWLIIQRKWVSLYHVFHASLFSIPLSTLIYNWFGCNGAHDVHYLCDFKDEDNVFCLVCRYQRYSTTHTPHNSERQRERQRGLVKQTFELDEAAATDRQDDQDDAKRRSVSLDDTPRGSWASSIFDLKNSSPDALLPSVLERTAAEDMDRRNAEARLQGRHSDLLGLFPTPDEVCPK